MKKCPPILLCALVLATALALPSPTLAQKGGMARIDSLMALLPTLANNDTNKVLLLNDLSFTYHTINTSTGIAFGNNAAQLAVKLLFKKGEAGAYHALCGNYWAMHNYLLAQKYCFQSLQMYEALHDQKETARALHNVGSIYESEYDYTAATAYYQKAAAMLEAIKEYDMALGFNADIADVLKLQKKYPEALRYFQKAIALSATLGKKKVFGGFLARAGLAACETGNYALALAYERQALLLFDSLTKAHIYINDDIAWTLRDFGTIYSRMGNYGAALPYFRRAFKLFAAEQGRFPQDNAGICLAGMGNAYLKTALHYSNHDAIGIIALQNAVDTLNAAVALLKPNDWLTLTQALYDLSTAQRLLGNDNAALQAYQQYAEFKDSLYNTETEKKVVRHQMEYEFAKKKDSLDNINKLQNAKLNLLLQEKKMARLQVNQQWIYAALSFILITVIALFFRHRDKVAKINLQNELEKERIEKQLRESEYEKNISQTTLTALISQMNPHFLFNALNTIQSFIYSNDKKNASSYLGKFSQLTRKILDNSSKQTITLEEELALLHLYLDIEKSRFGDSFDAQITTDGNLNVEDLLLPPMLIQPYVENAIKHGLLHKTGNKKLAISIHGKNGGEAIEIIIDDNGIGREKSMQLGMQKTGHQSFANAANEKRIALINRALDKKIVLQIIDKKNTDGTGAGTTVIFSVPVKHLT